ncbi:DUF4105 domain-containing protein [Alcaligenaceae bacterium]|nr:DUF4105 domain-containing protein [Alcaligenaceae bacterium]
MYHTTLAQRVIRILVCVLVAAYTVWGAMAMWYQLPGPLPVRWVVIFAWCALGVYIIYRSRPTRAARVHSARLSWLAYAAIAGALLAWWSTLAPSHQRFWADDVARMLESDVKGNMVELRNVRNFDWRSETDYTPRWETRHYDLETLANADLFLSYWMGPKIAHTLVSFGFDDGQRVVFSLEIRKEQQESFSAVGGFFRQFEQVIIAADERDIIRVRSNVRGEDVYVYRLGLSPEQLKTLFMVYLTDAQALLNKPKFYNSLTSNCTTIVYDVARHVDPGLPFDYRLLLSGYFANYAYDHGGLIGGHSFASLREAGRIHSRALAAGDDDAFSALIRRGVPGVSPA